MGEPRLGLATSRVRAGGSPSAALPGGPFRVVLWLGSAALVIFLLLPLVALVIRAIEGGGGFGPDATQALRDALVLSLVTSAISLLLVVLLGTPLAFLLARRSFPGRTLVETVIDMPMVLPPAVAGLALLMAFGRRGMVGGWLDDHGLAVPFTAAAVVLAQLFVAIPFFVRAARAGFARIDRSMEEAAADLGASPGRVWWTVTVPVAWPALAAGAVLAWARAVGEFGATIMFAGNIQGRTQTMPLAIYSRFEAGDLETALLLSVILLAASLLVLFGIRLIGGRGR